MAVEDHRRLLHAVVGAEKPLNWAIAASQAPALAPPARCAEVVADGGRMLGYQHRQLGGLAAAAGPLMAQQPFGQLCTSPADIASESDITFGGGAQEVASRKRKSPAELGQPSALTVVSPDVAARFQQQLIDIDRLVLQHTSKMWAELAEQRRRHARQVVAAVEAAAAKRLRAKDEEIQRIGRLNWALEERVKSLFMEAQVWRDVAQSNEAAAAALRGNLQQALDAQARRGAAVAAAGAEDAESCCCGENDVAVAAGEDEEVATAAVRPRCKACGEGAADVLLLPCRHLSACASCAAAAPACPACGCAKNGSVCVNFS